MEHGVTRVYFIGGRFVSCGEVGCFIRVILLHDNTYQENSVTFTWSQGVPAFILP